MLNNTQQQHFSIKQSLKKLEILNSSLIGILKDHNDHHIVNNNNNNNTQHDQSSLSSSLYKEISQHLENIRLIIEKKALKNSNSNSDENNKSKTSTYSSYNNSALKKSKCIQQLCEICISLFTCIKNRKKIRIELIEQALQVDENKDPRYLILIVEDLDAIMSHVLRQFLSRRERKSGKTDIGKKAQIYKKLEQDANGILLELFVFSLSIGCLDSKELLLIEHVSQNMEMKLQQRYWNTSSVNEDISSLGGVFLCTLINKNVGPHHLLWNEFMESVQMALQVMGNSLPGRERLLKSFYFIQLNVSHNTDQVVDIYKWVTVSAALSCHDSKYLPKEITNYLLDPDSLYGDDSNCKYITTRFLLKELRALHTLPKDNSQLLSYHIQNFEVANDLLKFMDEIVQGKSKYEEKLRKTCSEEMVFMSCLLLRFFLLRRRNRFSNPFYFLAQKFDLIETIFEIVLEYLVEKKNSFKSTYAYSLLRDLLYLISSSDGEVKFDPTAEKMIAIAEELIQRGVTSLDTELEHLKEWADRFFDLLFSQSMSSMYPYLLRKCLSSMLCRLSNSGDHTYNKSSLIEIVGHFHNVFFSTNSFLKRKRDHGMNRCLMTLVRFSAFIFLKIQPKYNDDLTKFYVDGSNLYREKANGFACRFSFLDSFYFDTKSQTFKVFAIEESVLEKQSSLVLSYQRNASLTDLIFIFEEEEIQDNVYLEIIEDE
ncbi:predicted protein [Naegleria gruberi]|uniref:Predicted protein n=1 Tax=Naegleria gruberi TaxID=5762 RepID=D2VDB5_NAEGR|nr:uncharacterized protein NAEGRDRAFT_48572 [Naegleria gruberi]EFC45203.1 predicted protein [Naegleria gruberi]|eukprot:XP_002677947.1 predicted protein [Naegleria gruberi strain NEG-M]